MKHDLEKLRRRLSAETRGIAEQIALLPEDADGSEFHQVELRLRDAVAAVREARSAIKISQRATAAVIGE